MSMAPVPCRTEKGQSLPSAGALEIASGANQEQSASIRSPSWNDRTMRVERKHRIFRELDIPLTQRATLLREEDAKTREKSVQYRTVLARLPASRLTKVARKTKLSTRAEGG